METFSALQALWAGNSPHKAASGAELWCLFWSAPGWFDALLFTVASCQSNMNTSSNGNIFPRYWPFVRGIHRSPVNSPHKGQWRGALIFSLICAWINGGVYNREAVFETLSRSLWHRNEKGHGNFTYSAWAVRLLYVNNYNMDHKYSFPF